MARFEGKVAIVTGAGNGMGKATALRLAREGAAVYAADLSDAVDATAKEDPDHITAVRTDVTKGADVQALVARAVDGHGRLDIVCNVVGVAGVAQGPIAEVDEDEYDTLMAINLRSVFLGMKYGIPALAAGGGGAVVNWSSTGALQGSSTTAAYGASKAGILAMTRSAALEWGPRNVRINAICPGFVYPTGMTLMGEDRYPELVKASASKAALDRPGHPDEIAAVAAFLASEDASYMTGSTVVVDGGWTAGG